MKPAWSRHRPDGTAKALTADCKRLGLECASLGGAIDAVVWYGPVVRLIDWKAAGGELTDSQSKLVARGLPIRFVSTVPQLEALAAEMKREATR